MSEIIERMRARILDVSDPNVEYSQADCDAEFAEYYQNTAISSSQLTFNEDIYKVSLKFVNKSTNPDPEYATAGSSGFDLRANLDSNDLQPAIFSDLFIPI
jgi:hypothetical protein